ncbi:DUF2029 domain-containing protein [bacterium]|nr:DUF2029 domain-containing protein [bacterium]
MNLRKLLLFVPLILLAILSCTIGIRNALTGPNASFDFQWDPARMVILKVNPYTSSFWPLERQIQILGSQIPDQMLGTMLPSSTALLVPYAFLPWNVATNLWLITNLVLTVGFLVLAFQFAPGLSKWQKIAIATLFVGSTSWRVLIGNGQHSLFSITFFLWAYLISAQSPILSGVLLAFGLYKYNLIAPLCLLFILRNRTKPILVATTIHVALTAIVSFWLDVSPIRLVRQTFTNMTLLQSEGWIDVPALTGHFLSPQLIYGAVLGVGIGICYLGWVNRHQKNDLIILSIMSIFSLLCSYHRIYDFILLLFPLIVFQL